MAYAIVLIRYRRPIEEVAAFTEAHRDYLRGLEAAGLVLASGPFDPRFGGMMLLRVDETATTVEAALDKLRIEDPYIRAGVAQYELFKWVPVIGQEKLDRL